MGRRSHCHSAPLHPPLVLFLPPLHVPPVYIVNLGSLRIISCKVKCFILLKGREGLMRTVSPIPHSLASSWAINFLNVRFRTMYGKKSFRRATYHEPYSIKRDQRLAYNVIGKK